MLRRQHKKGKYVMIEGGYYIMARKEKHSLIAHAPPATREVWHFLIREANHTGRKIRGKVLKRGQVLITYDQIRESLHWRIGFRKCTYTKDQIKRAISFLRTPFGTPQRTPQRTPLTEPPMIATHRTTRGLIITIQNYDFYQDPKNYKNHDERHSKNDHERHNERHNERHLERPTINNKERKKELNNINPPLTPPLGGMDRSKQSSLKKYQYPDWLNRELWQAFHKMRSRIRKPITTERTITRLLNKLQRLMNQGHDQDEIIQSAIDYCWQDFYPPRQPDDASKYV